VTLTPSCIGTYSETYSLDGSSPAFVTLDTSSLAVDPFTITTSDSAQLGTHTVTYTYEVAGLPAKTQSF